MFAKYLDFVLILLLSPIPILNAQADQPYAEILKLGKPAEYSSSELKSLRTQLEQERDKEIESCKQLKSRWQDELNEARNQLKPINKSSSRDTSDMADHRNVLHTRISTLEHDLRNKAMECDDAVPAAFNIKLAKLRLVERWPDRREEVADDIEDGRARDRKHGDVDDIGYRKLVKDSEKDIEVGEKAVRQLMSEGRLPMEIQEPDVIQYVHNLAARIAENSDLKVPLHLTVLDSSEIYPIALPGGYLFLTSGLIVTTRNEAELAGVISREIARIAARQGTRPSKSAFISKIFTPVAQVATGFLTGGVTSPGAYYGITYGIQGLGSMVDRSLADSGGKNQKEADQLGIQYAWKAGFDPSGFIQFLDTIAETQKQSKPRPGPSPEELGQRLLAAYSEIEYMRPAESYITDSPEFRRAKERLMRNR